MSERPRRGTARRALVACAITCSGLGLFLLGCGEPAGTLAPVSADGGSLDAGEPVSDASFARPDVDAVEARFEAGLGSGLTLSALLLQMVDLEHLTRTPEVPYTTHLQSSHNPVSDNATPGDSAWHADQDFLQAAPGVTETLLETHGPGVITRIWSASPSGVLRIFIDDAELPAVEAELSELLSGAVEPFEPPFAFVAAYGHNLYFPIAFARSCRITLTGTTSGVVYYHIGYRSYPEGTEIEPFGEEAIDRSRLAIAETAARLREPDVLDGMAGDEKARFDLASATGEEAAAIIDASSGGSVLRELRIAPSRLTPELLRATVLVVEMDGELTVRAPLLDFFAMGLHASEVRSLPVSVSSSSELRSRWPMPFERQARLWLEQAGTEALTATLETTVAPRAFTQDSLYFYAGFDPPTQELSKPAHDKVLARAQGQGFYVGNTLNLVNPSPDWWGEGDERVYVDGESFPSHFGTGTEDYYGYAWCSNQLYGTPYIGQTTSSSHQSYGLISLYRFHILDPIAFTESLRFDLEVRHWGDPVYVTYDGAVFWYARPSAHVSGLDTALEDFFLPELGVDPPAGVAPGAYRCGG